MNSGLYGKLVSENYLLPHEEAAISYSKTPQCYKIIKPKKIPFISYPYEWCFSELKDAALATLEIQKTALDYGMSLKDCSAFNIQFLEGKPVLIDTLSFEKYDEGKPWVAYKQFCQHFLAPIALAAATDIRFMQLSQLHIDGVPLDLAAKLLPFTTKLNPSLLIHIHVHASSQKKYADKIIKKSGSEKKFTRRSFLGLIDNLQCTIRRMTWKPKGTEWADYYPANNNYLSDSLKHKAQLIENFLNEISPKTVWDFGGNTGLFSRIASDKGIFTLSFDIDPAAVELNYRNVVEQKEKNILPLVINITNPSPGIGWNNQERDAFLNRGSADAGLALALIHHLAISNNLPLEDIAGFFSKTCNYLVIEFVPKEDSQVQKLLSTREDIFPHYTRDWFESSFGKFFSIKQSCSIADSKRILYMMSVK